MGPKELKEELYKPYHSQDQQVHGVLLGGGHRKVFTIRSVYLQLLPLWPCRIPLQV